MSSLSYDNEFPSYLNFNPTEQQTDDKPDMINIVSESQIYVPLTLAESADIVGRPLEGSSGKEIVSVNQCCTMSESKLVSIVTSN